MLRVGESYKKVRPAQSGYFQYFHYIFALHFILSNCVKHGQIYRFIFKKLTYYKKRFLFHVPQVCLGMFSYVFCGKSNNFFGDLFAVIRILKFDRSSFLQFPIPLGMLPFLSDILDFGFCSYRLSLLIRNFASSSKISLAATYLFCSSVLFLCSMDVAKHVGQLGLCMYRNSCLHYCISFKGI